MAVVGIYEARTRWAEILSRVQQGERFTITRHGVPIADLVPTGETRAAQLADVFARMRASRKGRRVEGIALRDLIREGERY